MNYTDTAKAYAHSGLSVIPTCADKRPACAWKQFTERIMSDREIETFFGEKKVGGESRSTAEGIGIVCGRVSGNLELLDFDDGGSAFEPWFCNIPEYLAKRLVVEQSPSGGKHVYYRVAGEKVGGENGSTADVASTYKNEPHHCRPTLSTYSLVPGNRKLAMKQDGHVLIETRGEGGYVKCAPSTGYELMAGDFCHVPTVSPFEQQVMIDEAIKLDEREEKVKVKGEGEGRVSPMPQPSCTSQVSLPSLSSLPSPLDIAQMQQALITAGWKLIKDGAEQHWERPGKSEHATSATFNGEVFYVFSSNAAPFEPNRGYSVRSVLRTLGFAATPTVPPQNVVALAKTSDESELKNESTTDSPADPGPLPDELLHIPGFVDLLAEHTLATAPYPNRPLAFAGALTMLSHLTGRNFRDPRNLRTNLYLLALADSGVGKDHPRKVNMNLATEVGIMPTMADRFASAEGLEDALLIHPASFFQVDEVDTLFAALQEKKDSSIEKIYGALLQFATSSDTTYAMRKKAIQQTSGKACKFDKVRARGIKEPHLTLLGCAIPKYLYSALSERALENGLLSRCLILEAGARGKAGDPHAEPFDEELLRAARYLVGLGGFEGLDLENLERMESGALGDRALPPYSTSVGSARRADREPYTVSETPEAKAKHDEVTQRCEALYDAADSQAEKALWTRGAEKTSRLALLYAISENVYDPLITPAAVDWGWAVVEHLTKRMLYQASVYVHDNEFDALRQKALRYLRDYGKDGALTHGQLLKRMHIDADTFRRLIDTLLQSELILAAPFGKGGLVYTLSQSSR